MKNRRREVFMWLAFLISLMLIAAGILCGLKTFSHFEELVNHHESHEKLVESVKVTAFYFVFFGSMVVTGVVILVTLLLRIGRATARIQREAELLQKKNRNMEALNREIRNLTHHQRLETIGTLTTSIAHEFNNLLTPIMGYSLMAIEQLEPEQEELYDEILEIYNASRKAKEIISRLNDLSRKNTELSFRQVSPDDLVRKTLSVAKPAKPARVEIKLDLNCWDQRLHANEIQMNQLLLNLILNGFHAMEERGGMLTISTGFDEKNIDLKIKDTGCGIPEDILPHIFDPFFTTKETGKGTGLGLAIVAQVVSDHNGTIRVESEPGKGTAFFVSLPRAADLTKAEIGNNDEKYTES